MKNVEPFFKLGFIDISLLAKQLDNMGPGLWLSNQQRQQNFAVHRATKSVFLLYDKGIFLKEPSLHPAYHLLTPALLTIRSQLEKYCLASFGVGNIARMLLVNLPARQCILPHCDTGEIFSHARRVHIPIKTNEQVIFSVNQQDKYLKAGEAWEINNCLKHGVNNHSNEDRIHLIIDWLIH